MRLHAGRPMILAVGDVRYCSVKRVASAVGKGSMATQQMHEYLRQVLSAKIREMRQVEKERELGFDEWNRPVYTILGLLP